MIEIGANRSMGKSGKPLNKKLGAFQIRTTMCHRLMVVKEPRAEERIKAWLKKRGFDVRKGVHVDVEARDFEGLKWVVEVKGDQANVRAVRNSFFTGLGQLAVARSRHPLAQVSFGLTPMYLPFVEKYADVLRHHGLSIIWVQGKEIRHEVLSTILKATRSRKARGQGHPDGTFRCGIARFSVDGGRLREVRMNRRVRGDITTFSALCEALDVPVGADSAARVLSRSSELE